MNLQQAATAELAPRPFFLDTNFPANVKNEVVRRHVVETLREEAEENGVVFVEGQPGSGATVLLSQFCKEVGALVLSAFIRPASRFAYDPAYVRLMLSEQIEYVLEGVRVERDAVDSAEFTMLVLRLRKAVRDKPVYFVIDGLHQIPPEDRIFVDQIMREVLPIGMGAFRFVISGPSAVLAENLRGQGFGTFRVPKLSDSEAESLLAGSGLAGAEARDIVLAARRNPGRLASVCRLLATGVKAEEILGLDAEKHLDFIKLEFDQADTFGEPELECIAAVAFAKHLITKSDVASVLGMDPRVVDGLLSSFPILTEDDLGILSFVSEAHRRYAERRFERYRSRVNELQIAHLRANPSTSQALQFLPAYYQATNNQAAIVDLLRSPDHYQELLASTQSMSALRARAMMGARSANELREASLLFQFALQQGIFSAIAFGRGHRAEVAALVALGEPQRALDVASKAGSNEGRLLLLAEYARGMRERGEVLDADVIAYIRALFARLDPAELGNDVHKLAENLLFVDADLALSLFDKNAGGGEAGFRDGAIARLAFISMTSQADDREAIGEKARQRIHNESLQKILSSLNRIVADASLDEVKTLAETFEIGRRVSFLRSVAVAPSPTLDVVGLVEYALDEIVRDAAYRPSMRDFLDLAQPISLLPPGDRQRALLRRLEGQIRAIEQTASSKDLVLAELCLARSEASVDVTDAVRRLKIAYERIIEAEDLETRVECFAVFLEVLYGPQAPWGASDDVDGLKVQAQKSLVDGIRQLLNAAADHFGVIESALASVAKYDVLSAMQVAAELNMATRRDDAHALIAKAIVARAPLDFDLLRKCVGLVGERVTRDRVLMDIVKDHDPVKAPHLQLCQLDWVREQIVDPFSRARASIDLLDAAVSAKDESGSARIESQLEQEISRVDSVVDRIELLFSASAVLARRSADQSIVYFELATDLKARNLLGSEAGFDVVRMCLSLLLRVMRPIIRADVQTDDFVHRYARLVALLPCRATQASYLSELATKAWAEGKGDLCRRLFTDHLRPLLDALESSDPLFARLSVIIYPAAFLGHRASSAAILAGLSKRDLASAIYSSAMVVLRKTSPSESWHGEDRELKVSYEDVEDALSLLELAPTDHTFYTVLCTLSKAAVGRYGRKKLTLQQKSDVGNRLLDLIGRKLPDVENIQHEGYVIASKARAYSILDFSDAKWRELAAEARAIANVADRQYVLVEIADSLPSRQADLRKALMHEAYGLIRSIPAVLDRLGRFECYISAVRVFDTAAAKVALREAMGLTFELDRDEYVSKSRRSLIDIAELIEPGFAEKIAEAVEDDPAREEAKSEIARAAALQKFKRQIASAKTEKDRAGINKENLPTAAWKNVGALASARITPLQPDRMLEYLNAASRFGFEDAFPVLSWYIENSGRRYTTRADIELRVTPLAEIMFLNAELAADMIRASVAGVGATKFRVVEHKTAEGVVLGPRDRATAVEYIRSWLRSEAKDEVLLCDPYFALADLDFLRLVLLEAPDAAVTVLTSRKTFGRVSNDEIDREWRSILDQDPPATEIVVVSDVGDDRSPVHDRWLLTASSGLRLGTSFSSLGTGRITEISVVESARVRALHDALRPFVVRERIVGGKRVQYSTLSL